MDVTRFLQSAISSSDHFLLSLHPLNTTTPLAQSLYTLCASINERRSRHHVHVSTHVANAIHSNARLVQGTQQDAHELFLVLLDRLDAERGASNVRKEVLGDGLRLVLGHSRPGNAETRVHGESVREFRGQLRPESLNGVCPGLQARAGAFAKGQKEQDSAMMGLLASHLACQMCGGQFQIRVDPFRDLSLPLPVDTASVSLRACLSTYFEPQVISDYWCWRCSALEAIETHADMLTASEVGDSELCSTV
ncbi:hypothetical protein SARC_09565 [Sphaeroforma arctica JP610]|uniref:Peptidase C19 ubiquitin carboxyl-terminal hydrolase domain-containing protein n=1 Tax=Sphaeroforma arctica JP610 TaxID=667725 RepID=A0A0L0FND2_9EUKA|nr:hypothetical protein SARC_09565 [Sphaeroforma arctica JP610]KNC77991.1 hypothetical protein SARC_09565 [Sphaeroforma arctica JP610]|eukprot:XP_014151893.1 hypothetical protein SARC_09565 [Sphaeroforma arctica JP610]